MYKTCKVCSKPVTTETGLQHGKCGTWTHFNCFKHTQQSLEISSGIINYIWQCPDCYPTSKDQKPDEDEVKTVIAEVVQSQVVNYQYDPPRRKREFPCDCSTQTSRSHQCVAPRILRSMRINDNYDQGIRDKGCQCSFQDNKNKDSCQNCSVEQLNRSSSDLCANKCYEAKESSSESNCSIRCDKEAKRDKLEDMCNKVVEMSKQVDEVMVKLLKFLKKKERYKRT